MARNSSQGIGKKWLDQAKLLSSDLQATLALLLSAESKAKLYKNHLSSVFFDFNAMVRMVRDWARGRYQGPSASAIILAVAGIAYFVSPVDAIFDYIPGIGLTDDVWVLALIIANLRQELERFKDFELEKKRTYAAQPLSSEDQEIQAPLSDETQQPTRNSDPS